jgi:glycerate dehydrogenase
LNKLLMLNFSESDLEDQYWQRLRLIGDEVVLLAEDDPQLDEHLATADALFLKLGMSAAQDRIDAAPNLRYIGMLGTGYGRIDTAYATSKGIAVCNVADYSTEGVAEFVFACLLSHLRDLERARAQAKSGDYSEATFTGSEIGGKVFGVVGLGHIGMRVAKLASDGFGSTTIYWSRSPKQIEDAAIASTELNDLLTTADIVSLHLEYNPETEKFIDRDAIMALRPGTVVINTAPMEIVDVDALNERLAAGDITFILDHSDELSDSDAARLALHKNCIMYPPIGYTTVEATAAKQDIYVANAENFLKGEPTNQVN